MRKRIAVFANGWGSEYLREVVTGAYAVAKENDVDVFTFVNFTRATDTYTQNLGEFNIFKLPDLYDYDGAILLVNSFNMAEEEAYVYEKARNSKIPVISVEYDLEGITTINSDNYFGMHELAQHVIGEHQAKQIVYIGGPKSHLESQERLAALKDVAKDHGLVITEDNILYGDWARASAVRALEKWSISHKEMPDVIVCANDVMAIGAVDYCRDHGYRVPEDVMVTGYDCTNFAQAYDPVITSVSHEWDSMGKRTMEILLQKMNGVENPEIEPMRTRFVCGESCGCQIHKKSEWGNMGRNPVYKKTEAVEFDSHFRHMYKEFRNAEDITGLHECMTGLYEREHWMESDQFTVCLEPEFFSIVDGDGNLLRDGYSDMVHVVCALKDGTARELEKISKREVLFRMQSESEEPRLYTVVPLSSEDRIYGFAILVRDLDIALDNTLYSLIRHISQDLEQFRRNVRIAELTKKLTMLSVTDVLTGIYNRAGCEKIAYPMIQEELERGGEGIVIIADVDRMKDINDGFGHASGDLALRTIADVLKRAVPEDWIVSRFGGDEFFVGGIGYDGLDMEEMSQRIMDELTYQIQKRRIKFDLSISIGYSILKPDGSHDVEQSLREADRKMYTVKDVHHKIMDAKK